MLTIYTTPCCSSCKKVKKWLQERNIPFKEKNMFTNKLEKEEIKKMLILTNNGVSDIISSRCKLIKQNNLDLDSLTLDETITLIQKQPSILKRPIIIQDDHKRIQIGYKEDEIEIFLRYDDANMVISRINMI